MCVYLQCSENMVFGPKLSGGVSTECFSIDKSSSSINVPRAEGEARAGGGGTMKSTRRLCWRICVDLPIACTVLTIYALFELGYLPVHKAGFYCRDPALSFVFRGDTVSTELLISTCLLLTPMVVFPTEFILNLKDDLSLRSNITNSARRCYHIYRLFIFGLLVNLLLVSLLKGILGSPRPVFFDLCQPDTGLTCNGSEFVSNFECTAARSRMALVDTYRSFPSGHSALSVYVGIFIAWYLQRRAFSWRNRSALLVPLLQLAALCGAAACGASRVTDRAHHAGDVLAGVVLGALAVIYTVMVLMHNFRDVCEGAPDCSSHCLCGHTTENGLRKRPANSVAV